MANRMVVYEIHPRDVGFPQCSKPKYLSAFLSFLWQGQRCQDKLSIFHIIVQKTKIISEKREERGKVRENTNVEPSLAS